MGRNAPEEDVPLSSAPEIAERRDSIQQHNALPQEGSSANPDSSSMHSTDLSSIEPTKSLLNKERDHINLTPFANPEAATSSGDSSRLSSVSATSNVSGDITVQGQGHYNPGNDVILRLEAMTFGEVRFLNLVLWIWLAAAAGVLAWQFCEKLIDVRTLR